MQNALSESVYDLTTMPEGQLPNVLLKCSSALLTRHELNIFHVHDANVDSDSLFRAAKGFVWL